MDTQTTETNHAKEQAAAQLSSIRDMVAALDCDYDRLEELHDERTGLFEQTIEHGDLQETHNELNEWDIENREELRELEADAGKYTSRDEVEQTIQEDPLCIELNGTWSLGKAPVANKAYILLCTGGPAVRIVCELDDNMQADRAYLQYQDWGTPWIDYYESGSNDTLLDYCNQLYFGE